MVNGGATAGATSAPFWSESYSPTSAPSQAANLLRRPVTQGWLCFVCVKKTDDARDRDIVVVLAAGDRCRKVLKVFFEC